MRWKRIRRYWEVSEQNISGAPIGCVDKDAPIDWDDDDKEGNGKDNEDSQQECPRNKVGEATARRATRATKDERMKTVKK